MKYRIHPAAEQEAEEAAEWYGAQVPSLAWGSGALAQPWNPSSSTDHAIAEDDASVSVGTNTTRFHRIVYAIFGDDGGLRSRIGQRPHMAQSSYRSAPESTNAPPPRRRRDLNRFLRDCGVGLATRWTPRRLWPGALLTALKPKNVSSWGG